MWDKIIAIFDGNWVDVATFAVAVGYAIYHCAKDKIAVISKQTGLRIAHGVALFPLLLLSLASLSTPALTALTHSHKIILSVAGVVALLAILEDGPPGQG